MSVSACSGGHPAEWIVTDVSQLGEGDRLPTHMKLTMGTLTYNLYGILATCSSIVTLTFRGGTLASWKPNGIGCFN